jgi:hypothetical protein
MDAALELACKSLPHPCHNAVVRDLIVKRLAEAAGTGERNPAKLSKGALHALSVDDMSMPVVSGRAPSPGPVMAYACRSPRSVAQSAIRFIDPKLPARVDEPPRDGD